MRGVTAAYIYIYMSVRALDRLSPGAEVSQSPGWAGAPPRRDETGAALKPVGESVQKSTEIRVCQFTRNPPRNWRVCSFWQTTVASLQHLKVAVDSKSRKLRERPRSTGNHA